ncbi:MAG: hypothetical protein N2037_07525 [Acidimicrobiales bacterium]|nr:hypothetical protein [Acidimicrobiales bacterium]
MAGVDHRPTREGVPQMGTGNGPAPFTGVVVTLAAEPDHRQVRSGAAPLVDEERGGVRDHDLVVGTLNDEDRDTGDGRRGLIGQRCRPRRVLGRVAGEEPLTDLLTEHTFERGGQQAVFGQPGGARGAGTIHDPLEGEVRVHVRPRLDHLRPDDPGDVLVPLLVDQRNELGCRRGRGHGCETQLRRVSGRERPGPQGGVSALGVAVDRPGRTGLAVGELPGGAHRVDDVVGLRPTDQVQRRPWRTQPRVVGGHHHPPELHHLQHPRFGDLPLDGAGASRRCTGVTEADGRMRPRHHVATPGGNRRVRHEQDPSAHRGGAVGSLGDVEDPEGAGALDLLLEWLVADEVTGLGGRQRIGWGVEGVEGLLGLPFAVLVAHVPGDQDHHPDQDQHADHGADRPQHLHRSDLASSPPSRVHAPDDRRDPRSWHGVLRWGRPGATPAAR